ncbi:MAG: hypothetical protein WC375_04725 [Methanomassiliicoccales archaeon]|jgi:flagellar capping protein FliD
MNGIGSKTITAVLVALMVSSLFFTFTSTTTVSAANGVATEWENETALDRPVYLSAYAQIGDVVYVFGGRANASTPDLNLAFTYDLLTGEQNDLPNLPFGVSGASAVLGDDGLIYIFGGRNLTLGALPMKYVQIFDPETNSYARGADMLQGFTIANAALLNDGKIMVIGGNNNSVAYDVVQIYDPDTNTWALGASLPVASYAATTVVRDNMVYYIGGSDILSDFDTVYIYYMQYGYWSLQYISLDRTLAAAKAVSATDGQIYVTGGGTFGTNIGGIDDAGVLNFATTDFVEISSMNTVRKYHIMAESSDGRLFVMGGGSIAGSFSVTKTVESLKIDDAEMTLSASSVGTGRSLGVTIDFDFPFAPYDAYGGYVELIASGGEVVDLGEFYTRGGSVVTFFVDIPQGIDPGVYQLKVYDTYAYFIENYAGDYLRDFSAPVNVTAESSIDEQLQDLQDQVDGLSDQNSDLSDQNANLSEQVEDLTDQLDETQDMVDEKFSATLGMVTMILVIIVLVVAVITLVLSMRKRP